MRFLGKGAESGVRSAGGGGSSRSGALQQAHKAPSGSHRVRDVEDWLADHLGDASHAITGTTEKPARGLTATVEGKARAPIRRGRLGRAGVAAIAVAAIAVVTISIAMVLSGKPATAAVVATPTPSPTPGITSSPTATPTLTPWPSFTPTPTPPRSAAPIQGSVFSAYVVRSGDTLTKIARDFGLSVTTLYWANAAAVPNPHLIKIGQSLVIPPVDGLVAVVAHGDTLETIADKYGIDPQVITDANNLLAPTLTAGQTLILPGVPNKPLPIPLASGNPIVWLNKLEWPVPSSHHLTLLYGCTTYAAEPRFGKCRHWHDAVDVGAKWGSPVVAAASGTVIYAGRRKAGSDGAGGGIVVWISHGGTLYTTYNHLSGVTVKAGQRVQAGDQVGRIGNTGAADGSHLHFEVWTDYPWTGGSMADAKNPLLYTKWKP